MARLDEPRRVLVVEDDPDLLALLEAHLRPVAQVTGTLTAVRACEALATQPFDAVVTDLRLGEEEGGLWVLAEARRIQPEIRCVLMTGGYPPKVPGVVVLAKPFGPEQLLALLE